MNPPKKPFNRHSYRLKGHDYTQPGTFFITICTLNRRCFFGEIHQGTMRLNHPGTIAEEIWLSLPDRFSGIKLAEYIIMPNHMHALLEITSPPTRLLHPSSNQPHILSHFRAPQPHNASPAQLSPISLGELIRTFKAATTRHIRLKITPQFAWQPRHYESIITTETRLEIVRTYIQENPQRWHKDKLYTTSYHFF